MLSFLYSIIIYPITQVIEACYTLCMRILHEPGFAIIGISVVVTLLCLPLYAIAEKWQEIERETKKKLQPKVDKINAVFKGDERYMILSTYYKQNHYHPIFALRSSISLLIQIPFFIAAYSFLSKLEALQGQTFLFIKDLGQQDALIKFGSLHLNLLPILMTIINCVAGAIYTKGFPIKEKLQLYGMALVFLVLLYTSPSGLVLYWTMNNVFSLVKNIFYKLKNPLKSFYIFCVAVIALGIIYILGFANFNFSIKMMICVLLLLICACPFIYKFIKPFFKKILNPLYNQDKNRFLIFILSAISLALLTGLVISTNTISSSATDFCFVQDISSPFYFIKNTFAQALGLFVFWPFCFYFLFNKKVKTVLSALFFSLLIFAAADVFLFTNISSTMSRTFVFSFSKPGMKETLLNFLVLIVCLVAIILLFKFNTKIPLFVSSILVLAFFVIPIVNCNSIKKEYNQALVLKEKDNDTITSITPLYHLSKTKENVIVIMIDRAISGYIPYLLEERPDLNEKFSGFTYYPNSVGFSRYTLMASAALWGGYDYTPLNINKRDNVSLAQKQNEALKLLPDLFGNSDYKVYDSDMPLANHSVMPDMSIMDGMKNVTAFNTAEKYTELWCKQNNYELKQIDKQLILRNALWYSIFKISPVIFRYYVYENGKYWSASLKEDSYKDFIDQFAVLDFLPELTSVDSDQNCCIFMSNETPHNSVLLQAPDYVPVNNLTISDTSDFAKDKLYHTTAAAIIQLGEFFDYLKEQGAYDNSRIIIASDHGNIPETKFDENPVEYDNKELRYKVTCTLLSKDFDSTGPIVTDNTFMTNADVPYLATKDLIDNPVNSATGNKILSTQNKINGATVTSNNNHRVQQHAKNTFTIKDEEWFTVKDDIFNNDNWRPGKNE